MTELTAPKEWTLFFVYHSNIPGVSKFDCAVSGFFWPVGFMVSYKNLIFNI